MWTTPRGGLSRRLCLHIVSVLQMVRSSLSASPLHLERRCAPLFTSQGIATVHDGARVSRETQGDMWAVGRSWSTSPASVGRLGGVGRMSGSLRSEAVHVMAGSPRPCRAPLLSEPATSLFSAQSSERTGSRRWLLRHAQFLRRAAWFRVKHPCLANRPRLWSPEDRERCVHRPYFTCIAGNQERTCRATLCTSGALVPAANWGVSRETQCRRPELNLQRDARAATPG